MNEEKLAIETLKALGAKDTSSPSQISNKKRYNLLYITNR
jgi:hypothetical protein